MLKIVSFLFLILFLNSNLYAQQNICKSIKKADVDGVKSFVKTEKMNVEEINCEKMNIFDYAHQSLEDFKNKGQVLKMYSIKEILEYLTAQTEAFAAEQEKVEFCGKSTLGECQTDKDCQTSGCSNQICGSVKEEQMITTCDWKDCYDSTKFSMGCQCIENKCQWSKGK